MLHKFIYIKSFKYCLKRNDLNYSVTFCNKYRQNWMIILSIVDAVRILMLIVEARNFQYRSNDHRLTVDLCICSFLTTLFRSHKCNRV